MYLLLWCQCRCFKWKKNDLFALCCVHKISGKVKKNPFYGSHSLKVAVTQNVRSQLSCFCFILNKLFLLRKMFFCLEVNWRQTFDPFVCSWGGTCCCSDFVSLEQEAGRPSFWLSQCVNSEGSLVLLWPPLFAVKGITCFWVLNLRKMVLFAGTQEAGASTVSLTTMQESGALLVWRAGVAEI